MVQVETGRETRQGEKGKPVLYVLVAAVILAVVAGAGVLTWQGSTSPSDPASRSGDAARQTATGSGPASREQPANPTNPAPAMQKAN